MPIQRIAIQRIAVRLTANGERHLKAGHPWLYDQSIEHIKGQPLSGDLAILFSRRDNRLLGIGLYDPDSPIRIKVLHQGSAQQIDAAFFRQQLEKAAAKRRPLFQSDTDSYRLLHGENDGFPALIADVYAQVVVLKVYSLIWQPYLAEVVAALAAVSACTTVVLRLSRNVQSHPEKPSDWIDGGVLLGDLTSPFVLFKEYGLRFQADVVKGHKTGFFLDHRQNRRRAGQLAKGRRVLDVFSYAGGFSVHALAGGATEVTSLDISRQALEAAQANVRLNIANPQHKIQVEDAFTALARLNKEGAKFGLVIIDPPSFAKQASEVSGALKAYERLTKLAIPLVEKGGILLLASCSARISATAFYELQQAILRGSGRAFIEIDKTAHDIDHPISFPEAAYLKSWWLRLL